MLLNNSALNTSPLNSTGSGELLALSSTMGSAGNADIQETFIPSDTLAVGGELTYLPFYVGGGATMAVDDSFDIEAVQVFVSSLGIVSSQSSQLFGSMTFSQVAEMADTSVITVVMEVLDTLGVGSADDIDVQKLIELATSAALSGVPDYEYRVQVNVAAVMALRSLHTFGQNLDVDDIMEAVASFTTQYRAMVEESSTMDAVGEDNIVHRIPMLFVSSAEAATTMDTNATLQMTLESMVGAVTTLKLGDDVYEGWVLHAGDLAFTHYTNYPFTGVTRHRGRYFGVADDGVYELGGDDDAGEPIRASVKTGLKALGTRAIKDAKAFYLGYTSTGEIVLKVTTSGGGKKREDWYKMTPSNAEAMRTGRFTIQRGLRATYWQFEICNKDGADFEIDNATLVYRVLSRRIR